MRRFAPMLVPLTLWGLATFFLLGRIGKWTDDYWYNLRDPATGRVQGVWLDRPVVFFRPLYRLIVPPLQTLLWEHDWAIHLIGAAAHGAAAIALYRLLLSVGLRRTAAALAALLLLVHPICFEVVFWSSALPTELAVVVGLWSLAAAARWERGAAALAGFVFATALVALSLNEQPAAMLGAAPLLVAGRGKEQRTARLVVAGVIGGLCAAGLYAAVHSHWWRTPSAGELAPTYSEGVLRSLGRMLGHMPGHVLMTGSAARAWPLGWQTIAEHPARAALLTLALVAGTRPWVVWNRRCGGEAEVAVASRWRVAAAFAAMATLPVALVTVLGYFPSWRVGYPAMPGLCGLLGLGLDAVGRCAGDPSRAARRRTLVGVVGAPGLAALAVMDVGFQGGFRDRDRRDKAELAALAAAMPNPAPGSVVVVARVGLPPTGPRTRDWDGFFRGVLMSWSPQWPVRFAYRRSDLDAICPTEWHTSLIARVDEGGITTIWDQHVPWAAAVPLVVMPDSRIELVSEFADESGRRFVVPQTDAARRAAGLGPRAFLVKPGVR